MKHILDDPMLTQSLLLSAALFSIGLFGVFVRRNLIIILICIELMLTAVNVSFVGFARANSTLDGQLATFFIVTVAAAESAVGLGLLISIFRNLKEIGTATLTGLKD